MYYEFVTRDESSDDRDGMMVEMWDSERGFLAEVFEDDASGERVLNVLVQGVPVSAVERLLSEAQVRLRRTET